MNPFRHSEATVTANFMTEAQMRKRHGWTADSKMPGRYVHLVNADVDAAIFEHLGIKTKEKKEKDMPKICHICNISNSHDAKICSKCGKPLSLEASMQKEEQEKKEREQLEEKIRQVDELLAQQREQTITRYQDEFFARNLQKEYQKMQNEMTEMRAELNAFRKDKK